MIPTMLHTAVARCFVLSASLVLLAGCHGTHVEEAEHHTPEHKPADFPAAVDRLLALHAEISNGRDRVPDQIDVFAEAYDVARWLPELAADSDLDELAWNSVYATSRRLETILLEVQSRQDDSRPTNYFTYKTELDKHHRVLLEIQQQFPAADALAADQSR